MLKVLMNEVIQNNPLSFKTFFLNKFNQELKIAEVDTNALIENSDAITTMDLEQIDHRYLLAGSVTGSVYLYDTYKLHKNQTCEVEPSCDMGVAIECLQWSTLDNGFFTCSSRDDRLSICDSNTMKCAHIINVSDEIMHHHMSPVATTHLNVAVATRKRGVILCDLISQSRTTTLSGHSGAVRSVRWNPLNEYMLASGDDDGVIRFWDIRRGKMCYKTLESPTRNPVEAMLFKSSGTSLICSWRNGLTVAYDTCSYKGVSMEKKHVFYTHTPSNGLALAPNTSPEILFVPHLHSIQVYNTRTGKYLTSYKMHLRNVLGIVHNPKHNILYSYGRDRLFFLWIPKLY